MSGKRYTDEFKIEAVKRLLSAAMGVIGTYQSAASILGRCLLP